MSVLRRRAVFMIQHHPGWLLLGAGMREALLPIRVPQPCSRLRPVLAASSPTTLPVQAQASIIRWVHFSLRRTMHVRLTKKQGAPGRHTSPTDPQADASLGRPRCA